MRAISHWSQACWTWRFKEASAPTSCAASPPTRSICWKSHRGWLLHADDCTGSSPSPQFGYSRPYPAGLEIRQRLDSSSSGPSQTAALQATFDFCRASQSTAREGPSAREPGIILGLYMAYIGIFLGLYWDYIGVILGILLGLYWDYCKVPAQAL